MCYICGSSPHSAFCPFFKSKGTEICSVCGSYIEKEDVFYKLNTEFFHRKCLRELNGEDICEVLEIKPQ